MERNPVRVRGLVLPALLAGIVAVVVVALGAVVPARAQGPAAPPAPAGQVTVGVEDRTGRLSPGDLALLRTETARIAFPPQVVRVEYLVFDEGQDKLNDTAERFAAGSRPELLSADRKKWAPGTLIVAVSLDPRRNGLYCGDDVCSAMELFDGPHLTGALEAMKGPLRTGNGNVSGGLLEGARAAADPSVRVAESGGTPGWIGWLLGGLGLAAVGGTVAAFLASRRKKAATARERLDRVSREYGRVAGELDGLDVRANSLTSPLADDELRAQWADVRDRFLALDAVMGRLDHLTAGSGDAEFRSAAADIETAHTTVDQMITAEENIDEVFAMEQGDATVRRRQLGELHEDMLAAALGTRDERLSAEVRAIDARADELARDPGASDFMDRYARIVIDYRVVVEQIRRSEMADVEKAGDADDRRTPRLYDSDWRVGYGYGGFVPYSMVSSWHAHDVQAAQIATSSSTSTSYSNASFSGGGGSSSW